MDALCSVLWRVFWFESTNQKYSLQAFSVSIRWVFQNILMISTMYLSKICRGLTNWRWNTWGYRIIVIGHLRKDKLYLNNFIKHYLSDNWRKFWNFHRDSVIRSPCIKWNHWNERERNWEHTIRIELAIILRHFLWDRFTSFRESRRCCSRNYQRQEKDM